MRKFVFEEFIRYDTSFNAIKLDFSGDYSPLSANDKKDFLQNYYSYHEKKFGYDVAKSKAVLHEEVDTIYNSIKNNFIGETFTAFKRPHRFKYEDLFLYTDRAIFANGILTLNDSYKFPVPCAKISLKDRKLVRFVFDIKIDESYCAELPSGVTQITTGRCVELRGGCADVVKLFFAQNGEIICKDTSKKTFNPDLIAIGNFKFGEWQRVAIELNDDKYSIEYDNKKASFDYGVKLVDNIFFGGGMQPVGKWQIRAVEVIDSNGQNIDFTKSKTADTTAECLGEVTLPYAIGGYENRDYDLILKKSFVAEENKKYILNIDAIDPCGEVYLNGKRIYKATSFAPLCLDISKHISLGTNSLGIVVFPRAPENLFSWHKNDDYYGGWLCLGASIKSQDVFIPSKIVVKTLSIGITTKFNVKLRAKKGLDYKLYLQKVFPVKNDRKLLGCGKLRNDILNQDFIDTVDLWNIDTPNLYSVTVELLQNNEIVYFDSSETGFRTVCQKNGEVYLNGERVILKGALNMQFLPPFKNIPVNHVCPPSKSIIEELLAIKKLNGNCMRLHQLGYGCGDKRFAMIADRMGVLLIWTTRLIDSAENIVFTKKWEQKADFQKQMLHVINCPSIIMWEGSNELRARLDCIDRLYDEFVGAVEKIDKTRLICPVSHLYYGGGIYEFGSCNYYNNDGTMDCNGNVAKSSYGWTNKRVIRSAHTYDILLGYGKQWRDMAEQKWALQYELLNDKKKAYIVSEYAVIGRQNPETEEAQDYINTASYEYNDEIGALGFKLRNDEWKLSQAHQALCAKVATKKLIEIGADGYLWCALRSGANNASYLKPIIDFYGYKKLAFYQLHECFQEIVAFNKKSDVLYCRDYVIEPFASGLKRGKKYSLKVNVLDTEGNIIDKTEYKFIAKNYTKTFKDFKTAIKKDGYYIIQFIIKELSGND